jgi:hypothetical protein
VLGLGQNVQCSLHWFKFCSASTYCPDFGRFLHAFNNLRLGAWLVILFRIDSLTGSAFIGVVGGCLLQVWRQLNKLFCPDWFPCFPIEHSIEQVHLSFVVFSNLVQDFVLILSNNQIINDVWQKIFPPLPGAKQCDKRGTLIYSKTNQGGYIKILLFTTVLNLHKSAGTLQDMLMGTHSRWVHDRVSNAPRGSRHL